MDEDCIESVEPIYELASECEKLFSEQISKLEDEANLNGAKVVGEYQQRFSAWAAFLGVFAVPEMCLDRRLQRHVDIQDLALRLLDIMKRNLTYLFEPEIPSDGEHIEVSDADRASSPQPQLQISMESLRGIEGAIERLHHLGGTIQLSSEASQATKLGKFAAKFDSTSFEGVARLAITSFYPDASPSLIEQLARAMTDMYQKFHYRRSRQVRLQPRPQLQLSTINEEPASQIKAATWEADPPPAAASPPINDIYKRLARPIVMSHLGARSHQSKESKPTSLDSQEFKKLFPQRTDGSVKSKTKSIAANLVAYPQPSEASLVCDWCFLPLSEDEFKGDKWKKHLNEDFKPFLCLSEKCSEPLKRFATSRAWFSHMLETHGQNWHREAHLPVWWSCPLCNNQETTYPKAQDLSEHISKLHSHVFTEQQIQIIVHQSRLRAPRPQDTCPLCCLSMDDEQNTNQDDQLLKKAFPKLPIQGEELTESSKRIKTETGSVQLDQHNDTDTESTEQETPNPQNPASQSRGQLNIETIAKHVAAHLQGIMLFSLRMIALDAAADKSADDKTLSGNTDNDLSRLGSNQQFSLPETQEIVDSINDLLVQNESMDIDSLLVEDTIPDCEHDMNWQDFIPNSEPPPEADAFLQQVIDSGAFQAKERSPARETGINSASYERPITVRPRTPPATIIIFPFRHDPDFTGHETILHDLVSECSAPPARLALVGLGGIGKTQLAIELAYRLVKLAKMSVFWVNAESRSSLDEGFKTIALNVSPWRQESTEASLRASSDWLSEERNGRWIMILDGVNDHSIFQDQLYLPKSRKGTIIITTRHKDVAYRLTGNQQDVVEIGPMSVFEAVSLLEKKLGRTAKEPFPKHGVASGLVKSLGLIPLAICRAAAYIQSTSVKLPIKNDDGGLSYRLDNSDSFLRRHHFDHAKIIPENALAIFSTKSSNHGDSPPPIAHSDEEDVPGDTFMYEGDEEDHIINHGNDHKVKDGKDFEISFDDEILELSAEEETEGETVDEKMGLLHFEEELLQLIDSEQERIKLLEFEVYSPDRSGQILSSLFRTFKSSFDAIRFTSSSAADLLSLMSFFERRGIPKWLLRPFRRANGAQLRDVARIGSILDDSDDESDATLNNDIEILLNHCLITTNRTRQMFEMHGLIQLSVKKNLDASQLQTFEQHFIKRLAIAFPKSTYSNWATCEELFAHVQVAANIQPAHNLLEDWANLLHNGGRFARLQGRYEIAMQMADQALIARENAGKDDVKALTLIALILMDRGLYDRAEELFEQVMNACKRINPDITDRRTEISMNNLASIYKAKGRWTEAVGIQTNVAMNRVRRLGPDHQRTLASKANLASIYRAQGWYLYAEIEQTEVVEGYRKQLGPDHYLTLRSMNNLGSIYRLQGKLLEAESLQVQAFESLKIELGGGHPDTLTCMNSLASTYRARGLFDEAEALQEETVEIRTIKLGSDHPHTLASTNNLALIYSAQGKHQRAAKLQSEVVEICKEKLGPEHPHTLTSLNNIALIWKAQGRDADGRWKMDECAEARLRVLGQNHPYTISSREAADNWWASSRYVRFPDIL